MEKSDRLLTGDWTKVGKRQRRRCGEFWKGKISQAKIAHTTRWVYKLSATFRACRIITEIFFSKFVFQAEYLKLKKI